MTAWRQSKPTRADADDRGHVWARSMGSRHDGVLVEWDNFVFRGDWEWRRTCGGVAISNMKKQHHHPKITLLVGDNKKIYDAAYVFLRELGYNDNERLAAFSPIAGGWNLCGEEKGFISRGFASFGEGNGIVSASLGYAVVDLRGCFKEEPLPKVKINDEYTAEVDKDSQMVHVGCQAFPFDKVRELAKAIGG